MMPPSILLNDLYQFTMAYGYWREGISERHAVFHANFRQAPFNGEYIVLAGTTPLWQWLSEFRVTTAECDFLCTLTDPAGQTLFPEAFLNYLHNLQFNLTLSAAPEGSLIFAHEPWLRIEGPLLQCQLLETPILNTVNFQSLIATKATRICQAAAPKTVIELGLRRAHGPDGGLSASRAAYIGGCHGTSNVLAGQYYGIPIVGSMAHSWVMSFPDELHAFNAFAEYYPNNCALLVDTYNSQQGIAKAIDTATTLRAQGHTLKAIRLDSGDLTYLSQLARMKLDEADLHSTQIIASNDLDEYIIADLQSQQAAIDIFGVGTKLVTAFDQPALGGVYKISALKDSEGLWQYKLKLSESLAKISTPGRLNIARYYEENMALCDVIYDDDFGLNTNSWLIDPLDPTRRRKVPKHIQPQALLHPYFHQGQLCQPLPPLTAIRSHLTEQLTQFSTSIKRLLNPHRYAVGLEQKLHDFKMQLVQSLRNK